MAQASGSPEPTLMYYWAHSMQPAGITTPQSATLGLHPVIHVPNYIDYYLFTDPWGMEAELAMLADR